MKFLSFFFILLSLLSLFFNISHPLGLSGKSIQYYENLESRLLFGFIQLSIGILFFILSIKKQKQTPQYTKCPNCKEVFNYNELINGKCKNCKDVDTIDLDEYFEKYPDELEEKD
jgi:hypothetical protein